MERIMGGSPLLPLIIGRKIALPLDTNSTVSAPAQALVSIVVAGCEDGVAGGPKTGYQWGVWESFQTGSAWAGVGVGAAWVVTSCLLLAGIVGCVLPVLPGHLILFIAAVAHRLMLGAEGSGLHWWSFLVLALLMAVSQTIEMVSGAVGTRWFGGSRWGALGALLGSIAGLFFLPFGLLVGPLVGAVVFEIGCARKQPTPAVVSGVGSVVGTLTGMVFKIGIGALMVLWFFLDVFLIG